MVLFSSVAFSQDGRWLASGTDDKTIMLWDPATGVLQQTLRAMALCQLCSLLAGRAVAGVRLL